MQAAVGHEEHLPARHLAVDHAADIDRPPRRRGSARARRRAPRPAGRACASAASARRCSPIGCEIERLLAGEVRDAEPAADVDRPHRPGCVLRELRRQLERLALRLADRLGLQVLRPGEDVEPLEARDRAGRSRRAAPAPARRRRRTASARRPSSCRRTSARSPGSPAPQRAPEAAASPAIRATVRISFADSRFTRIPAATACSSSPSGLARPRETDLAGRHAARQRHAKLARGRDVEPVDLPCEVDDERRHRVRLDRVVQLDPGREVPPKQRDALVERPARS